MANVKKLGTKIDQLYRLKLKMEEAQRAAKKLEDKYNEEKEVMLNTISKEELGGTTGKLARISVVKSVVPTVEDWNDLYKYIYRNKAWDMLQRRVSSKAYKERLDAGKKVPGVKSFTKVSLRVNKL